jgi:hypothetical protein
VTLYRAGTQVGAHALPLGTAQTDSDGSFSIAYTPASDTDAVLYLIADGARPARGLGASATQLPVSYRPKTFAMTVMIVRPTAKPATA